MGTQHLFYSIIPNTVVLLIVTIRGLHANVFNLIMIYVVLFIDLFLTLIVILNNDAISSQSIEIDLVQEIGQSRNQYLSFNDDERWFDKKTGGIVDPDADYREIIKLIKKKSMFANVFGKIKNKLSDTQKMAEGAESMLENETNLEIED